MTPPFKEWWKMSEPERIVWIIREVGCSTLGNWDGCCCSRFSVRNVDVDVSCGKGREQAVWVSGRSMDYATEESLRPIMTEVVRQVSEQSGRGPHFAEYIKVAQ
jgi:hypothetical protein